MSVLGIAARFLLAGAVGSSVVLGVGAAAAPPPTGLLLPSSTDVELTADTGDVVAQFTVEEPAAIEPGPGASTNPDAGGPADPGTNPPEPVALSPVPEDAQISLVAYKDPNAPSTGGPGARPNWLAPTGHPRITPITQFDGGALGGTNCTMASGAMLARLGFGLVTTGSQLRSLQPDQEGGTSLADLQVAIGKFGISYNRAALSPLQLRAVMYAGAGAVIQGTYGIIPYELRLQKNFLGGHAIYIDGFRPASAAGPAAYFVIDPLGRPGAGYRGAWWPADIIEAFATDFGGGRIYTAWAFPGGKAPTTYPQLPSSAFPTGAYRPDRSAEPGVTPAPVVTPPPGVTPPPLPESAPGDPAPPAGDSPPDGPSGPVWTGPFKIDPSIIVVLLNACAAESPPAWCPDGVVAELPPAAPIPTLPPLIKVSAVDLLYANPIGPDQVQVVFKVPEGTLPALQYWNATGGASGIGYATSIEPAILNGEVVQVATFAADPAGSYQFVASAAGAGVRAVSKIGALASP